MIWKALKVILKKTHWKMCIRDSFIRFHEEFDVMETVGSIESFMHLLQIDHRFKTDIILLDIGLPGVSGLDGIPMILEKMPEVDIIMLTSYEEEDVILRALCSGACSYPVSYTHLDVYKRQIHLYFQNNICPDYP